MTKTKKQLRAEAVERLKAVWPEHDSAEVVAAAIGYDERIGGQSIALAELLDDEEPAEALTEEADSREKLGEDANGYVVSWWDSDWVDTFEHANIMKRDVMRLLDRQDAITERECREYENELRKQHHKRIAELQDKADALRREAAALRGKLADVRKAVAE